MTDDECPHGALAADLCPDCLRARRFARLEEEDRRRRQARAERDEAMARVEEAADDGWKDRAWDALMRRAADRHHFTTDDIWDDLDGDTPREPRALGPLVMRAVRAGLIADTGAMAPSRRRHHTKQTVWAGTAKAESRAW